MLMIVNIGPITLNMLINMVPNGGKLSGEFGKLTTELIINYNVA